MTETTKTKGRVLIVDDEWSIRDILSNILQNEGFECECAEDGAEGIKKLDEGDFHIVITDLKMPKVSGMEVLKHIQGLGGTTLGIIATGYGSIESAVEALRAGAYDYITKPFHLDEIRSRVNRARDYQTVMRENKTLRRQLLTSNKVENLIGNSPQMQSLKQMILNVADSDSTVLILGDSGTGKELVARAIHFHSERSERPLIPVNCGAIPEGLLESELFGHVKGAFTGATNNRMGRFQMADGGTIFLDEIGDMSPKLQVKILRVLQEQQIEPVGGIKMLNVNVRVMTATNRNLEQDVAAGNFREDLYYRLNVIPIHIPPLRDRREDIPILVAHFVDQFKRTKSRSIKSFTSRAMDCLMNYEWPGNVRELENVIERMTILHQGMDIDLDSLPEKFAGARPAPQSQQVGDIPDSGIDFNDLVDRYERVLIQKCLDRAGGVKNKAAALLNIKRTTLVEKMKKKGMLDS